MIISIIIRHDSTHKYVYNNYGDKMKEVIINIILIIFPILMYLVFTCYNSLNDKKIARIIFIITMFTSLYFSIEFNHFNRELLIFCNIPILICYLKKEGLLGVILSSIVILLSYLKYDVNIYIITIKYLTD